MSDYRLYFFFFFNDTATTEIYTLSLHDALPICLLSEGHPLSAQDRQALVTGHIHIKRNAWIGAGATILPGVTIGEKDRKSTRLNSSHANISYAVFCLKKKKQTHSYHHISTSYDN